jgi:hypothetical protein
MPNSISLSATHQSSMQRGGEATVAPGRQPATTTPPVLYHSHYLNAPVRDPSMCPPPRPPKPKAQGRGRHAGGTAHAAQERFRAPVNPPQAPLARPLDNLSGASVRQPVTAPQLSAQPANVGLDDANFSRAHSQLVYALVERLQFLVMAPELGRGHVAMLKSAVHYHPDATMEASKYLFLKMLSCRRRASLANPAAPHMAQEFVPPALWVDRLVLFRETQFPVSANLPDFMFFLQLAVNACDVELTKRLINAVLRVPASVNQKEPLAWPFKALQGPRSDSAQLCSEIFLALLLAAEQSFDPSQVEAAWPVYFNALETALIFNDHASTAIVINKLYARGFFDKHSYHILETLAGYLKAGILQALVRGGRVNPNCRLSPGGPTILHYVAAMSGQGDQGKASLAMAQSLLAAGANPREVVSELQPSYPQRMGDVVAWAAASGNLGVLSACLEHCRTLSIRDK